MSQDSKINAETHDLLFGDQQKPKQIQKHIPHKNIKKTYRMGDEAVLRRGEHIPGPGASERSFNQMDSGLYERK